jgi:uncharacterized protein (DUF2235 family)
MSPKSSKPSKLAARLQPQDGFSQTGFVEIPNAEAEEERTTEIRKRLIVCCDGTWFASDKGAKNLPSNVARIGRLVANEGEAIVIENGKGVLKKVPQIVYYQSGVGTGNLTFVDKRVQGKIKHLVLVITGR